MVDRTYLPYWKVSIAVHVLGPGQCGDYLDAQIRRAPSERVRRRLVALKHRMSAVPAHGREGRVVSLRSRRR